MVKSKQQTIRRMLPVLGMLLVAACGQQTSSTRAEQQTLVTATQDVSTIHWEEVTAATSMVRPTNSFLIMMR